MKKIRYTAITSAVLIIFSCALIFLTGKSGQVMETAIAKKDKIIVVDPGHGGIDGGAVGVGGVIEKDINLSIALKLRDNLNKAGYKVIMTRDTDISIHSADASTIRQKKASDLKNRLAFTTLYPDSVYISIHQNTINIPSVTGAEVFYSPNNPQSKLLAEILQTELNNNINENKKRTVSKAGSNLYIFYRAQNTAVLVECGFLSNADEEAKLTDDEYQQKLARLLCDGIKEFLKDV